VIRGIFFMAKLIELIKSWQWEKFEKTFGGLKFAVSIILLFTVAMIAGTFIESYYGTEFANRLVYKSLPFMLLQGLIFLSVILAAFVRTPFKSRLTGFYIIHFGILLIGAGSFITYYAGVDGNITLVKGEQNRTVMLYDDIFLMTEESTGKQISYELPFAAFTANINASYGPLTIKKYLPSSENEFIWEKPLQAYPEDSFIHSSQYLFFNDQMSNKLTLSLHPESNQFESMAHFDSFSIFYLPKNLFACFLQATPNDPPVVNSSDGQCTAFATYGVKNAANNNRPAIFLFGESMAIFKNGQWMTSSLKGNNLGNIPWMGLNVKLLTHSEKMVPTLRPFFVVPIQQDGKVISGTQKALLVNINGEDLWITDGAPLRAMVNGKPHRLELSKVKLRLPFEFMLTKFKMDMNPGTQMPASYESFVKLFLPDGNQDHHIYMNNPLKMMGFTFYQSSYFETNEGDFGSVLSANVDPGRPIKYWGSLLLVLGAMIHYYIIYRRKKENTKGAK